MQNSWKNPARVELNVDSTPMKPHQTSPPVPSSEADTQPNGIHEVTPISPPDELTIQKDRYLRLAADFDNFRKRTLQESDRRAATQKEALIHELLPVVDNFERALSMGPQTTFEQLVQGVNMILQQLRQILRQNDIESEENLGQPFDPLRHEAIGSRHDPSRPDQAVLETTQRGYRRGQEIFRPAKVIVNDHSQ